RGDEYWEPTHEAHTWLERTLRVAATRVFRPHRQIVQHDFRLALLQDMNYFLLVRLPQVGRFEAQVLRVGQHVAGNAVQDRTHFHLHARGGNLGLESGRTVGGSENGFRHILAHLARIHVKGRHHADVLRPDASNFPMHQAADIGGRAIPVIVQALNQGTCTIAETNDGDFDHVFLSFSYRMPNRRVRPDPMNPEPGKTEAPQEHGKAPEDE